MIENLGVRELGLVGIALLVAIQALQLVPKRNGGKISESQRAAVELAASMVSERMVPANTALAEAIAELARTITEGRTLIVQTLHQVEDLHRWHSPDSQGRQGWKGVPTLGEDLRAHFQADDTYHHTLEGALRDLQASIDELVRTGDA